MFSRIYALIIAAIIVCSPGVNYAASDTVNTPSISLITNALNNYINYHICWDNGGTPYRFGTAVQVALAINKGKRKFYIWGDNLQYSIGRNHPYMANLYTGTYDKDRAVITGSANANTEIEHVMQWLYNQKKEVFIGEQEHFTFIIPSHCKMVFPPSAEKTRMINAIKIAVTKFVEQVDRISVHPYYLPLHIIIANFDIYYPYTVLYFDQTHELYELKLHDNDHYFDDPYLHEGYPIGFVGHLSSKSPTVMKIKKYGIHETINLGN